MRVTTYDIAKACGVSQATVDRALNNRSNIKPDTKERILNAARELGYRPSYVPTYLKTCKSNTIGVIMPSASYFYAELMSSITEAARVHGYHTCISFSNFNEELEKEYLSEYLRTNVDGIILFPTGDDGSEIRRIINAGVPVVTLVRKLKNYNFDFVTINYASVSEQAVQYLITRGHSKICYFTIWDSSSNLYTYRERLRGYETALKKHDITIDPRYIIRDSKNFQLLKELLTDYENPTAYFCFNDLSAISLMNFLNLHDIKVPQDASIISFDNIDVLKYLSPGITSIAYPYDDISAKAMEILIGKINNETNEPKSCIFDARIIHRNSCRSFQNNND